MKKLISWIEIPTVDFDRAVEFYNSILDLNLEKIDCGHEKMACFPNDEGAIVYSSLLKPCNEGVLVSFNTGDQIDLVIEKIEQNGGTIVEPKTKIEVENLGYFSLFIDSEGNKVGLYGDK